MTQIAARLDVSIVPGAMTAPPHCGEEITLCPSLITLSPDCRSGPAQAANHKNEW